MDNHIHVELDFIPVEERLPDEDGEYQVIVRGWEGTHVMFYDTDVGTWSDSEDSGYDVTHWSEIQMQLKGHALA